LRRSKVGYVANIGEIILESAVLARSVKGVDRLEDLAVDRNIILKWI
jgi:hypothetical protein